MIELSEDRKIFLGTLMVGDKVKFIQNADEPIVVVVKLIDNFHIQLSDGKLIRSDTGKYYGGGRIGSRILGGMIVPLDYK